MQFGHLVISAEVTLIIHPLQHSGKLLATPKSATSGFALNARITQINDSCWGNPHHYKIC